MKISEVLVREGADFLGYTKNEKTNTWEFPDGFESQTPHRSNMAVRELLGKLGYNPDFENEGPMEIDDFIAKTGGDTDREVKMYNQEALRIKKTHPELTHVAFA